MIDEFANCFYSIIKYLHEHIHISIDAAASILTAFSTLILGIIITILVSEIKSFSNRRKYRALLKINLISLIDRIDLQRKSYNELEDILKIEHIGGFPFTPVSISAKALFYHIGYDNLFTAYFKGFENFIFFNGRKTNVKEMAFNNIWNTLEFLNVFHEKSFDSAQIFFKFNLELNEKRNQSLGRVQYLTESLRTNLHGQQVPVEVAKYFNVVEEILLTFSQQENYTNPKKTEEFFIQPILALNRASFNDLKQFLGNAYFVNLNAALLEASLAYLNQKKLFEATNAEFSDLANSFLKHHASMKESLKVLS